MNYELAKELKDAGFPFKEHHPAMGMENIIDFGDGEDYKVPTLSELIEACGNEFLSLTQISKVLFKENWRCEWLSNDDECVEEDIYGKTPEEAVAKLWLELNKK